MDPLTIGVSALSFIFAALEYDKQKAKDEIYQDGVRKGNVETKKKLLEIIEEKEKHAKGAFALALYVANLDGYINRAEEQEIESVIGVINEEIHGEGFAKEVKEIFKEKPSFTTICSRYFDKIDPNVDKKLLDRLDEIVRRIIYAAYDNNEPPEGSIEDTFYNKTWLPFKKYGYNIFGGKELSSHAREQIIEYIKEGRMVAAKAYVESLIIQGYYVDNYIAILNGEKPIESNLYRASGGKELTSHIRKQIIEYIKEGRMVAAKCYIESLKIQGYSVDEYSEMLNGEHEADYKVEVYNWGKEFLMTIACIYIAKNLEKENKSIDTNALLISSSKLIGDDNVLELALKFKTKKFPVTVLNTFSGQRTKILHEALLKLGVKCVASYCRN